MKEYKKLKEPLQTLVKQIVNITQRYNAEAFLVGGPLRDLLMTKGKSKNILTDLDIAVTNSYYEIGKDLAKTLKTEVIHYPQFMTMTLQCPHLRIDVAQTRKEYYSRPAVLPQVSPASIEEDLKRRDFTINAMALKLTKKPPYPIIDLFNGQKDLKSGIIRILHTSSFSDDPTRIFRAIRFAVRLGFEIEPMTKLLMKKAIFNNQINLLSGERILHELKMILKEKEATRMLKTLQKYGIIKNVFGVQLPKKFFQESQLLDKFQDSEAKLSHLFAYLPESTWSRFPLTNKIKDCATAIKKFSQLRKSLMRAKSASRIYQILSSLPKSTLETLSIIEKKPIREKIKLYLEKYSKVKFHISGKLLQSLQIPSGPIYRKILENLRYQILDGKVKNKEQEIEYVRSLIKCQI
ncbi:MAG: CCA tRNA nucleotidyltransferase [candidate division WOR-3 bacterium]